MNAELDQRQAAMRAPWVSGDHGVISRAVGLPTAEEFVAKLGKLDGLHALDVACGTGAATLPMARAGATTTGVDLAPNLLRQARDAAAAEGLTIRFDEGFAEELPYADGSFDLVTSMFGVMFSPFPDRIATELSRVLTGGGRVALANWTAEGMSGDMRRLVGSYATRPADAQNDFGWGDENAMRSLLDPHFEHIETTRVDFFWEWQGSPDTLAQLFIDNAGPMPTILAALVPERRSAFLDDFHQLFADRNEASAGSASTRLRNQYLDIRAVKRRSSV